MSGPRDPATVLTVRRAAERLARRIQRRQTFSADLAGCPPTVPVWWREGLALAPVFGDGLMSLPPRGDAAFSRPVAFLSPSEISATAGGEYVPLAWMDGGAAIALVHDRDQLAVVSAAIGEANTPEDLVRRGISTAIAMGGGSGDAELIAGSLVEFLDALVPQTVCRFVGPGGPWTIELADEVAGELAVLVERGGAVERLEFDSDDALGEHVANFVVEALDADMDVVFCPARIRHLIAMRQRADMALDVLPEVRARAAIRQLLERDELELVPMNGRVEAEVIEDLIDGAARFLERNQRRRNLIKAFADWLTRHEDVDDLYADDDAVREALAAAAIDANPDIS